MKNIKMNQKNDLLFQTWKNLNEKFPNWKNNKTLKNEKKLKNFYMRSVNKTTFKIYSKIFSLKKQKGKVNA